jgi:hypothetical protein
MEVESYWVKIYIAGDYHQIIHLCRKFCFDFPFCVTINKNVYVYKGGVEDGVEIGIINYARFPRTKEELVNIATRLANKIMEDQAQISYTILSPEKSIWFSRREDG